MKKVYLSLAFLASAFYANAQCPVPDEYGSVNFNTQAEIDAFPTAFPNCNEIDAELAIFDFSGTNSDILNLDGLSQITSVTGGLFLFGTGVTNINGLANVVSFGGAPNLVAIVGNPSLSFCAIKAVCAASAETNLLADDNSGDCEDTDAVYATCTSLPVTLVSFNVRSEGSQANLTWKTAEETNSKTFEVQHSMTGGNWSTIGYVKAAGESFKEKNYNYTDKNPGEGNNYYRLKMVDADNSFAYSTVQNVNIKGVETAVYPNPVSENFTLKNTDVSRISKVQILSVSGQVLADNSSPKSAEFEMKGFPAGMYIVKVVYTNGNMRSLKVTKK